MYVYILGLMFLWFYFSYYVYMCEYVGMQCPWRPKVMDLSATGVTGWYAFLNVGAGNRTQVF